MALLDTCLTLSFPLTSACLLPPPPTRNSPDSNDLELAAVLADIVVFVIVVTVNCEDKAAVITTDRFQSLFLLLRIHALSLR